MTSMRRRIGESVRNTARERLIPVLKSMVPRWYREADWFRERVACEAPDRATGITRMLSSTTGQGRVVRHQAR